MDGPFYLWLSPLLSCRAGLGGVVWPRRGLCKLQVPETCFPDRNTLPSLPYLP